MNNKIVCLIVHVKLFTVINVHKMLLYFLEDVTIKYIFIEMRNKTKKESPKCFIERRFLM